MMKSVLALFATAVLALPAAAQDDVIFLNAADVDALLGGGRGRGNPAQNLIPDPAALFTQLRDLLRTQKVPLEKNQGKSLQALIDKQVKEIRSSMDSGNRGTDPNQANRGASNPLSFVSRMDSIVTKQNAALLKLIKASLASEQTSLVSKAEKDKKTCLTLLDVMTFPQLPNRGEGGFGGGGFGGGGFGGGFPGGGGPGGGGFPGGGPPPGDFPGPGGPGPAFDIPTRPQCTTADSTPQQRLNVLGDVLTKGKRPLTVEQTQQFVALIDQQMALVQEELTAAGIPTNQFPDPNRGGPGANNPQQIRGAIVNTILSLLGFQNANGAREGRGGNRGTNLQADVQARTDTMFDKIITFLKPNQQPVVKKLKYDQVKQRGGATRIRAILEEEGTPLTAEQFTKVQTLFNTDGQSVRDYAQQLVDHELQGVPAEELQPSAQSPGRGGPNGNPNSLNQNPRAQQIVAKLLPLVSVRRAQIEKSTLDSVMKIFTPAQVASYKVNTMYPTGTGTVKD